MNDDRADTPEETRLERWLERWVARAVTPRGAAIVIASATIAITFITGTLMTVLDRDNYPTVGSGLWWAVQTDHDGRVRRQRSDDLRRKAPRRVRHAGRHRLPDGHHRRDHEHIRVALAPRAVRVGRRDLDFRAAPSDQRAARANRVSPEQSLVGHARAPEWHASCLIAATVGQRTIRRHRQEEEESQDDQRSRAVLRPLHGLEARAPPVAAGPSPRLVVRDGRGPDGGRCDPARRPHRRLLGRAPRRRDRRRAERRHPAPARRAAPAAHARPWLPARPGRGRPDPARRRRPHRRSAHGRQLRLGPARCARGRGRQRRARRHPRLG